MSLAGTYKALVRFVMHHGPDGHVKPGESVDLTHEQAEQALAQGTVEKPKSGPHIMTLEEFVAEARRQYPNYVEQMKRFRARDAEDRARADDGEAQRAAQEAAEYAALEAEEKAKAEEAKKAEDEKAAAAKKAADEKATADAAAATTPPQAVSTTTPPAETEPATKSKNPPPKK
jgi:hypothetical protein